MFPGLLAVSPAEPVLEISLQFSGSFISSYSDFILHLIIILHIKYIYTKLLY